MKNKKIIFIGLIVLLIIGGSFLIYNWAKKGTVHPAISVDDLKYNQVIASPLTIKGQARGFWFFEASFPIKLYDANNNLLAIGLAQAQGEWMTEDFVPFEARLEFAVPATSQGKLVLEKDNPSGLPANDDELVLPVRFSSSGSSLK